MDCSPTIAIDNLGYFHVAYITDDPGSGQYKIVYSFWDTVGWHIQTLTDSYLGPYGTGASPYIAVSPQGIAHIVYRGGDYGNYHIHHAWNDSVGGSTWNYEILMSGNGNDFAATLVIEGDEDLHLAVSGNDGFGFPGRVYYFYQPVGQSWQTPELASLSYSATRPAISVDFYGSPHVLWLETSGTMYTGNIFYSRRDTSGSWQVSSVIGQDHFFPSFKVDNEGFGHVACNTGGNSGIYDIYHIRSGEPLTAVEEYPFYHRESGLCYLSQNYPNPFRYYTIINYHIPNATIVTLKVYNILGEEVAALVNGFPSAGNYQAKWYVADIPSGVYFYRIQAGPFTQKKKCLLLK
ncbi:MAG: T9SS type A sorting domain-containing protein [Candidatus Hodarchaeota archaeon]